MTWTTTSGARSAITKIAIAAAIVATPAAAVNIPAYATPGFGGTPAVLPAPPPADPPTEAPAPPAPPPAPQAPAVQRYDPNDWWYNGGGGDGGGGGGG